MNASLVQLVQKYVHARMSDAQIAVVLNATGVERPDGGKWSAESVEPIARPDRERAEFEKRSDAGKRAAQTRIKKKRDKEREERRDVTETIKAKLSTIQTARQRQDESEAIARVVARLQELGRGEDADTVQSIYESLN